MSQREGTASTSGAVDNVSAPATAPDPEVVAKPTRRRFTTEYKLRILREAESLHEPGAIGALLRREGLYSTHLTVAAPA